jgi:hypothetical protein
VRSPALSAACSWLGDLIVPRIRCAKCARGVIDADVDIEELARSIGCLSEVRADAVSASDRYPTFSRRVPQHNRAIADARNDWPWSGFKLTSELPMGSFSGQWPIQPARLGATRTAGAGGRADCLVAAFADAKKIGKAGAQLLGSLL